MLSTAYARVDRQPHPTPRAATDFIQQTESRAEEGALLEKVHFALRNAGHFALRDLEVELEQGVIVLWGRVGTYYQKQLAQVVAQRVDGVRNVANGLEVICQRAKSDVQRP